MNGPEGKYITYKDIKDVDLMAHFSSRHGIKKRAIETFIDMCDQWGCSRTHETIEALKGPACKLTYREIRYIHRAIRLHKELLSVLRPGAMISEEGILSRLKDDVLVEVVNGERRIRGTYRQIVFRRA